MTTPTLGGWLVHVMREADGALSLEEALHSIMDSIKEFFPCQSVAVILIDEDTKELRIKISRQISYTFVKKFQQHGPSPTAERVVLEQQPLLLNRIPPDSATYRDLKLEHDFTSAVLAPVLSNQRGTGYIFCDRANGEEFNDADLLHLQVIGYLVGSLIQKFDLIRNSKRLSRTDDATNTLQYKAFVPALSTELQRAREHSYPVTLAMLTVSPFRHYLDTYGIKQAHALLAEVAEIVKRHTRDMDILARFGADEFVLCLSGISGDKAMPLLQTIRREVADKAVGQGESAPVSLGIGALAIADENAMTKPLRKVLAALGKVMVAAKAAENDAITMSVLAP